MYLHRTGFATLWQNLKSQQSAEIPAMSQENIFRQTIPKVLKWIIIT